MASRFRVTPQRSGAPPRLVKRFALYAGLALIVAAGAAFVFVRHYATEHAEDNAKDHAAYIAEAILPGRLSQYDLKHRAKGRRLALLDRLAHRELLVPDGLQAKLYAPWEETVYSTEHRLIGERADDVDVAEALSGEELGDVSTLDAEGGREPNQRVLETYVPVKFNGHTVGVFELYTDYAPIAREATAIFIPLAIGIGVLLIALYLSFFPILRRASRQLTDQFDEIERKAYYDELTGLPNRELFELRTSAAAERAEIDGSRFAVLLVDLDRFKDVNDTLGHASGDALLTLLAADLPGAMRDEDTVARLGGDEFGILALDIADPTAVLALAEKLRGVLGRPRTIDGVELEVGASVGIALRPDHGTDAQTLLRRADVAMYRSKEVHAPALYESEHDGHSAEQLGLAAELHRGIERGELVVAFQPKYEPARRQLVGAEALVRWQHPRRGLLPPDSFIPLAERTGLVRELTAHVLDVAVARARWWGERGLPIDVAVNISPRDLLDPSFPDEIESCLVRHGVPPSRLELEITENEAITDLPRARRILARLNDLGVQLAIDDFGTGSTSLAYFRDLPIDVLKIDRSFVKDMDAGNGAGAIVHSTIALAHDLGLRVVAEGVETEECNARLASLGCDIVQGFFYSPAVPGEEITDLAQGAAPA